MRIMKKLFYLFLVLTTVIVSCSKDKKEEAATGGGSGLGQAGSTFDLIRDSVYLYSKEDYLWYDALPGYDVFNPRGFTGTSTLDALTKEVDKISQYKINPA